MAKMGLKEMKKSWKVEVEGKRGFVWKNGVL